MKVTAKIPKTLLSYCQKHEEKICDVYAADGYNEGFCYDILLNRGWCTDESGLHTIIEPTIKQTLEKLRAIEPCSCRDCVTGEGW